MSHRVPQIDSRLAQIEIEKQATQNEQLLILLAQERLALTNERISLTSAPAPAPGNYPILRIPSHTCRISILFALD